MPANARKPKYWWMKFDGEPPFKIVAYTFMELMQSIERETMRRGKDFEWLIRNY